MRRSKEEEPSIESSSPFPKDGFVWIMLDMPQGMSIAFDNGNPNLIGPRFRGYKLIPLGYHVVRIGENYSMTHYFDDNNDDNDDNNNNNDDNKDNLLKEKKIFSTKWNPKTEELEPINLCTINKYEIDSYLACANTTNHWMKMTKYITTTHVKRGFSDYSIRNKNNLQGADLTDKFMNRNWQLSEIIKKDWKYLIGEFQMAHVLSAFGLQMKAYEQWRTIIEMICHSNLDNHNDMDLIDAFIENISWQNEELFTIDIKRWIGSFAKEIPRDNIRIIPENLIAESDPEELPVIVTDQEEGE